MRTKDYATAARRKAKRSQGSILAYLIIALLLAVAIAGVGAYVSSTAYTTHRRCDMVTAEQYAEGGAVIACYDLNTAVTAKSGSLLSNLVNSASSPYIRNASLSTSQTNVYQRTITFPFTNQTVSAQIWLANVSSPGGATINARATVGSVTQTATVNVALTFGNPAAIISVNDGTRPTSKKDTSDEANAKKSVAQDGNVVVAGTGGGPLIVDGGAGWSVQANGMVYADHDSKLYGPTSMTNYSTANPIPDYTAQGTTNALFDFNRFIAVANATPNTYNAATHNNHFTNVLSFSKAVSAAPGHTLEGVVVVDINSTDKNWTKAGDANFFPYGINIRGTLFYNFGPGYTPTDKFVVDTPLNINPANLTGLVATNPGTYPTGYPPVYSDPSKNPININIAPAYQNFTSADDLPALMNSIGMVDIHGPANVSGVCYTPSYMEVENKQSSQTQYFKGTLIMGWGIYYENNSKSTSIISYDANALRNLATSGTAGKQFTVTYWQ